MNVSVTKPSDQVREYVSQAKAENTVRAYRNDWADFMGWCRNRGVVPLPASADTVAAYLAELAGVGKKVATIKRRVVAISQAHKYAGYASPTSEPLVRATMQGVKRVHGAPQTGKSPATTEEIRLMVDALPDTLLGVRDRALLLVGFAGAFRRSELVALDVAHIRFVKEGLRVTVRKSKTDQEGAGQEVGIPYGSNPSTCPVRALQDWLEASSINEGAIFRIVAKGSRLKRERIHARVVAKIVKRSIGNVGIDPSNFSGHSLRAGLITAAAEAGVSERSIMNQSRHRSLTVMRRYIRSGSLFKDNAAARVGL